jgi:hypothetical protein
VPSPDVESCKRTASLSAAFIIQRSTALCIVHMFQIQLISAFMVINEPFYATILSVASFSMFIDMNREGVEQKVKKTLDHHCLQLSMVAKN